MPNKIKRDKHRKSRMRRRERSGDSVKDLLTRNNPALQRLAEQRAHQARWRTWLDAHLPAQSRAQLCGIVERHDTLVLFTASAAWSARLRFAIAEIEAALRQAHPQIARVEVRVLPG
jgi:hypothetical protein